MYFWTLQATCLRKQTTEITRGGSENYNGYLCLPTNILPNTGKPCKEPSSLKTGCLLWGNNASTLNNHQILKLSKRNNFLSVRDRVRKIKKERDRDKQTDRKTDRPINYFFGVKKKNKEFFKFVKKWFHFLLSL